MREEVIVLYYVEGETASGRDRGKDLRAEEVEEEIESGRGRERDCE